jgi:hypothetical protein
LHRDKFKNDHTDFTIDLMQYIFNSSHNQQSR